MSNRRLSAPHQKDTIGNFICPENGYRGHLQNKGIVPKNHMKENLKELRVAQVRAKEQREQDERVAKPLYKLAQFKNIPSKLYDEKENALTQRRASLDKEFLPKGQSELRREALAREKRSIRHELEEKLEEERMMAEKPSTPRKAPVPRAFETADLAPPSNTDFISRNRVEAIASVPSKKDLLVPRDSKHDDYGRVPAYIEERKAQWAEQREEVRRRMPDPDCPPGMRLMPEAERLQTLEILKSSQAEAMNQLQRMPFVIETPSLKRKQEALETKLREIEHAGSIFSKPKVYVAGDR
jgi:hypothetical protein